MHRLPLSGGPDMSGERERAEKGHSNRPNKMNDHHRSNPCYYYCSLLAHYDVKLIAVLANNGH